MLQLSVRRIVPAHRSALHFLLVALASAVVLIDPLAGNVRAGAPMPPRIEVDPGGRVEVGLDGPGWLAGEFSAADVLRWRWHFRQQS